VSCQRWFALQVKSRWEGSTAGFLANKGYETFLPEYRFKKKWSGKIREVSAPLFPGYIFCNFDPQNRLPILITPGVVAVVGRGRVPVPIEDSEIASIQTVITSGFPARPWPYLEIGQRIRIEDDVLNGLEGILVDFRGKRRIVVSITLLRRSVALEIDRSRVRPMEQPRVASLDLVVGPSALQGAVA
jgi:transcription antitermination factor NusG